ncbi:IclR family transcriptional regulator domain-containing protein [Mesorhizobium sp. NZP2298]|uniref:IclR family transcriptional regulator domain-containing protein n=1 Tax=Mesorhizobium sp. NZP2298 TaxID=2483403 RepID=UPI001551D010|nr:IclR family transcriptional regulator C-terminal domain-containing protein [Mesorhizobium sp. NZP2298]QKC93760.1 IclR family transcriptional regulator [Mesorhizobium sp. NZP2298]
MDAEIQKRDFAQTLARGLACLERLAEADTPLTCTQVAHAMDVSRAAARRILLTLESLGYVREERGVYGGTPKVLSLGRGVLGRTSVWNAAASIVVTLADQVNEPCSISVLEGLDIMFVSRDSTRRIYTSRLGVGDRLPAYCSASGKMLLASLPVAELDRRLDGIVLAKQGPASVTDIGDLKTRLDETRQADFARAIDEMENGTISIAVPLRERSGRVVAAMSVASHRDRQSPEDLTNNVLPRLREAARDVEGIFRDFQERGWATL